MRRIVSGLLALAVITLPFAQSSVADANSIAGGGYSSSYAGESVFTNSAAGETGQMSAIFFNDGSQPWAPGVVGLLVCAADKTTCNVTSNLTYKSGWFSDTVYATVTSTVAPGQNGFFIYDFAIPLGTTPGTVTTFYGDVGLIATGAELRPEGYFQINTVPLPTFPLSLSPANPSVAVGSTQQFTLNGAPAGAVATWSLKGGCGAVTTGGLFAATSMNSASQPCSVVAAFGDSTASTSVIVYGLPSQLTCTAAPTAVVANGGELGGTSTITIALKDVNGNIVTNASTPLVQISNSTPSIGTATPTGTVAPVNGVVTVAMASTLTPGAFEVSAAGTGVTGCFVFVTTGVAGPTVATVATFLPGAIASDGTSVSTLRIDAVDAGGNRALSENTTQVSINGAAGGNICGFTGSSTAGTNLTIGAFTATATFQSGRVELIVRSTTTPGSCSVSIIPNNLSIAGTSATLTTQIVGPANKLGVISSDSPRAASLAGGTCSLVGTNTDPSCTRVVVEVRDFNGAQLTGDNGRPITASLDSSSCASGSAPVAQVTSNMTTAGRATFAFRSSGSYPACVVTFNSAGLNGTSASLAWTGGGADHLACTLLPISIFNDGSSTSNGQVTVRDVSDNVLSGYNYTVIFNRTAGVSTALVGSNQQAMVNGFANFTVRSIAGAAGSDTYTASMGAGGPVLPHASLSCQITVHP